MSDKSSHSGGVGFFGLLTILFIGLKLTHYIMALEETRDEWQPTNP